MLDADDVRFIREEIGRQVGIILTGQTQNSAANHSDIINMFAGMPAIEKKPTIFPYGYASVAPDNVQAIIGRMGSHFGNRIILGHRAADRPTDLAKGEAAVYSVGGYSIRVKNGSVQVGKGGVYETQVVGETLAQALSALISALASHTHMYDDAGSPSVTQPPQNASAITNVSSNFIDNGKILAKDGGRF